MERIASSLFALAVVALLGACPGSLENPERFDGAAPACDAEALLIRSCGTNSACHDADAPQAGLDLVSPGVAARLIDVSPMFWTDAGNLVDSADPQGASFLLDKLHESPSFGLRMPPAPETALPEVDVRCLSAWIDEITGGSAMDAAAADAATDAATDAPADAAADASDVDAAEGGA